MRVGQLIGPELQSLLRENPAEVTAFLDDIHPEDLADILLELDDVRAGEILEELPTEYAAQVFGRLDSDRQATLARTLGAESTAKLAGDMDADDRADFFSMMPTSLGEPILVHLGAADPEAVEELQELQRWPETSAGGLMTTDYISIAKDISIGRAIAEVRESANDAETLNALFVTSPSGLLLGVLTLRRMLLAASTDRVEDVMLHNVKSVPPELDQEDAARLLAKYDLNAMPVVDETGKLLGLITADDILDVLTDEQSEDVHKMGAMEPLKDGYFDTAFLVFLKKRAPWLLILFFGGFLTTTTMQNFESELSSVTQLAFYLPLLIAAGGNSGSQSSTLIIRGLALGDVQAKDWFRVFLREFGQGLTLGLMLAILGFCRAMIAGDGFMFAALVATTIVTIVLLGCVIGAMTPILLHRAGVDPATSSTPFIATIVDVMGILVYLTLARAFIGALAAAGAT